MDGVIEMRFSKIFMALLLVTPSIAEATLDRYLGIECNFGFQKEANVRGYKSGDDIDDDFVFLSSNDTLLKVIPHINFIYGVKINDNFSAEIGGYISAKPEKIGLCSLRKNGAHFTAISYYPIVGPLKLIAGLGWTHLINHIEHAGKNSRWQGKFVPRALTGLQYEFNENFEGRLCVSFEGASNLKIHDKNMTSGNIHTNIGILYKI